MSLGLIWSNFVAYSLQIGLLVGVTALAPSALRLRSPRARLAYWHLLLLACLLLPAIRPWQRRVVAETVTVTSRVISVAPPDASAGPRFSPAQIALAVVALGAVVRLVWLAAGLWRLRRFRKHSRPYRVKLPSAARVDVRIAEHLASPVTFGAMHPVILLPARFPEMDARAREAIVLHELLHVERGDWLFTVGEEVVRSVFWFHPAIWWLLGEIQLAREQAVDREVIERTNARDEYVDALLAIAGAKAQLDLAPAPLFLRKRHLKHRVVSILKESRMSKTKLLSALTASLCVLVAACWLVTNTFPLAAAPQVVSDSPGVTVDVGGASLMHRAPVEYPAAARSKGVQGVVMVELTFDASGNVADAKVVSGPEELRKSALQSTLQWHFSHEAAGNKRQVSIAFQMPVERQTATETKSGPAAPNPAIGMMAGRLGAGRPDPKIRSIDVTGVGEDARRELLSRLSGRVGTVLTREALLAMANTVHDFDEHLIMPVAGVSPDEVTITVMPPPAGTLLRQSASIGFAETADSGAAPQAIRVGGNVQSSKLIRQPRPAYPPEAKEARIQGVVKLLAVIAADGTVKKLEVLSGHPMLIPSALDAVKQWVYQTTLLNGNPVEVQTQIDVNYTLSQ